MWMVARNVDGRLVRWATFGGEAVFKVSRASSARIYYAFGKWGWCLTHQLEKDCFARSADSFLQNSIRLFCSRCFGPLCRVVAMWLIVFTWLHADGCSVGLADNTAVSESEASKARLKASESLTARLPAPPEAIAKLIADGAVIFDFYDEKQNGYAFAGETTFDFRYEYRCQTRYRMINDPESQSAGDRLSEDASGRALEVTLDYEDVALKISHRMRLPSRLVDERFFDQQLVKHEFDHVAISADPRLPTLLVKMLSDRNSKVIVPLSRAENESRDRSMYANISRNAASQATSKVFEDFVSLVRIRYKELDQVTRHGIVPLAAETRLRLLAY